MGTLNGRRVLPIVVIALLLIGVTLTLSNCSTTVQPGNVGVKIRTLGASAGVDPVPMPARWYLVGIGERIIQYPAIQRTYTYTRESDDRGTENEEISFSDNNALPMTADVQIVLRVDPQAMFTPENTYFQQDRIKQVVGVKLHIKSGNGAAKPGMPADGRILLGS